MGIGELFALVSALCWALAVILFKHAGNSLTANGLNLTKNVIGLSLLIPTALLVEGLSLPALTNQEWLVLIVSGYFGIAVADTWYFQALRMLGAGRTAIVASLYSPFVVLLSIVFLYETMVGWQWLGFVLVLMGVLIVTYQKGDQITDKVQLFKGMAFAAVSVFLTAASVVAMKPILSNDGFFWLVSLRMLAGVVGMLIYLAAVKKLASIARDLTDKKHKWLTIISASVLGTYLAISFWLAGFKYADASVASVLNETSNVMIVLLAWLLLKEALTLTKIVGALFTFVGVLIFMGLIG